MKIKTCLECKHFKIETETSSYSEMTPGDEFSMECSFDHWKVDPLSTTEDKFREFMAKAGTCKDFIIHPRVEEIKNNNKKSRRMCHGCNDDFYNGNNDYGIKECWSFESADVTMTRKIPIEMRPPWDSIPLVPRLSCFRKKGYVFFKEGIR